MSETLTHQRAAALARDQAHTLFAQTMGYVAATGDLFALGAYLGRSLPGGAGIVVFLAAFAALIGMQFAARRSKQLTIGLLGAFGLLTGLALAPALAAYASMDPQALWQAGQRDRAVHRRLRRGRLRHPARPHGGRPGEFPGAAGPLPGHQLRALAGRVHLPGHPERLPVLPADLLARAAGDHAPAPPAGGRADHAAYPHPSGPAQSTP